MNQTMKSFSIISNEQTRQKVIVEGLERDVEGFKKFMGNSNCKAHDVSIENLKNANSSKSNYAAMGIVGIITSGIAGLLAWLAAKQ